MKEKMLIKMERDRFLKTSNELAQTLKRLEKQDLSEDDEPPAEKKQDTKKDSSTKTVTEKTKDRQPTKIPKEDASNPYMTTSFEPFPNKNINPTRNLRAHNLAVTAIAIHPRKPFIATGSDDCTWKIWSVPGGEMIIQGESHKSWVSGLDFNPLGTNLATCSGDSTVKIWDFVQVECTATFKCHASPVYGVSYHHTGDFLVSGKLTIMQVRWTRLRGSLTFPQKKYAQSSEATSTQSLQSSSFPSPTPLSPLLQTKQFLSGIFGQAYACRLSTATSTASTVLMSLVEVILSSLEMSMVS
jgi:WD40 repeat protein